MAKQKTESNQGLVVSLVFFILISIALGVTTYLGYSGQEGAEQKIKDANTKTTVMTGDRDWYRWQAMAYRMAIGRLKLKNPEEFDVVRRDFIGGNLEKKASDKDEVGDVKDLIAELEKKFPYDDTTKRYRNSYEGLVTRLEGEVQTVTKENADQKTRISGLEATIVQKDDQLKKQKTEFDAALAKFNKDNQETVNTQDKNRDELQKKVMELTDQNAAILTASAEEKKKLLADLKKALDTVADQKRQVSQVSEELLAVKAKATVSGPKSLTTDWKIATIQGNNPYINLGSADNVKPQLTFNIHGVGPDGRPVSTPKGTLEVVNVIGPHISRARITDVVDRNRNPVLVGDVLSNPAWDPFQKRRVALAGVMDMYGDGIDNMAELRRALERQNVVIDSYLDLKDFSIKGAMTLQTEYLILGDGTESLPLNVRERDGFGKKLSKGMEDMQAEARKNGVPLMGLRKFLDSIGYKVPRPTSVGR